MQYEYHHQTKFICGKSIYGSGNQKGESRLSVWTEFAFAGSSVLRLKTGQIKENCYLIRTDSGAGVLIDPGDDATQILEMVKASKSKPSAIVLTHAHFDHIGAVQAVRQALGIPVWIHAGALEQYLNIVTMSAKWGIRATQPEPPEHLLEAGKIVFGDLELEGLFTPGHAPGHLAFYSGHGYVISGDALFRGTIGRTDGPEADHDLLIKQIKSQLLTLPLETMVFPGHGNETTIGAESQGNPHLT
jgi:hydroxyacylglutathione hydrolase